MKQYTSNPYKKKRDNNASLLIIPNILTPNNINTYT